MSTTGPFDEAAKTMEAVVDRVRGHMEESYPPGVWVKYRFEGDTLVVFYLELRPDGTLVESMTPNTSEGWTGTWKIRDGALTLTINEYIGRVKAPRGNLCEVTEFPPGSSTPHQRFTMLRLRGTHK